MGKEKQAKGIHPLLSLSVIFFLSLGAAVVVFGILESTGTFETKYGRFGGAAAGFFMSMILLYALYRGMEKRYNNVSDLKEEINALERQRRDMKLPKVTIPRTMEVYYDFQNHFLFSYPKDWMKDPMTMQLRGVFREDPARLRAGDTFPGSFNVMVSNTGQQTYSVKQICLLSHQLKLPDEKMEEEIGIQFTEQTMDLQVPLERLLSILEPEGKDKREKIYNLNCQFMNAILGSEIKRKTEYVDNIPSLLMEYEIERPEEEPLICFQIVTYLEEEDLLYIFTFIDNVNDREYIESVRKQVMGNTKFWNPQELQMS